MQIFVMSLTIKSHYYHRKESVGRWSTIFIFHHKEYVSGTLFTLSWHGQGKHFFIFSFFFYRGGGCSGMPAKPTTITLPSLSGARIWVLPPVREIVWMGSWSGIVWMVSMLNMSRRVRSPFSSPLNIRSPELKRPVILWLVLTDERCLPFRVKTCMLWLSWLWPVKTTCPW